MKSPLIAIFLLCAASAFGQAGSISNVAQPTTFADHPAHASQHEMAAPQNILDSNVYSYAKGERPLWEFGPMTVPVPLGDVARAYREQHALAPKAQVVFEKYVAENAKK